MKKPVKKTGDKPLKPSSKTVKSKPQTSGDKKFDKLIDKILKPPKRK